MNTLYYGDNLDNLRKLKDETVDLCYIDPPFNSKRSYNQIYNNTGGEDKAQTEAFQDTWSWRNAEAEVGFQEILCNERGRYSVQTVELIKGLEKVLTKGPLLAYLVSMTRRVAEIHRVLKPTGSFYLHCDPTSSHYLKLMLDGIFCARGGDFLNELDWCYSIGGKSKDAFGRKHDVILLFTKSNGGHTFNQSGATIARKPNSHMKVGNDPDGREFQEKRDRKSGKVYRYYLDEGKIAEDYWTDIETLNREDRERLGYPTQKPEALMQRIIKTSSNEGDVVLDAYCGCGTTIAVAQRLNRTWIGMDITYQSISLILRRLGKELAATVRQDGVPRDMASAEQLAHKKDDRCRKEFEKWAVLTYTENRAAINNKKGADAGIDGTAYFWTGTDTNATMVFQVKSGQVERGDIAKLKGDMEREKAAMATLITLREPSPQMRSEARMAGFYELLGKRFDRVRIVTVKEIIEGGKRLELLLRDPISDHTRPPVPDVDQMDLTLLPAKEDMVIPIAPGRERKPAAKRKRIA